MNAFSQESLPIAVLHGAGYVGGELIAWLLQHPACTLTTITSETHAGAPVWQAHPHLRGFTDLHFSHPNDADLQNCAAVLVAAGHKRSATTVQALLETGFTGKIVDLSADFRFPSEEVYPEWFGFAHPAPDLLPLFQYGAPEVFGPYPYGTTYIANPGCFATGLNLALWPLAQQGLPWQIHATALTGASGSGAKPSATTHFPTRAGNVRAYKVLTHQHLPEIQHLLGPSVNLAFVPASGPWTRGIWGTAQTTLPDGITAKDVANWFENAYADAPFVRCWPDLLPELRLSVGTPFCDVGWVCEGRHLVIGFALDNLCKGAATQAIQNLNLLLGLPEATGLLPTPLASSLSPSAW